MGWGDPPHEGYPARRLTAEAAARNRYPIDGDQRWTSANYSDTAYATEGWQARCSCGWKSEAFYPNTDPRVDFEPEDIEKRMYTEWHDTHMAPMVDPEPDRVLVLGQDEGGARHFLAGQPVHAGTVLELRLLNDMWIRIRYEWDWQSEHPPYAYLVLGGRGERLGWDPGIVSFPLPERAELRWAATKDR